MAAQRSLDEQLAPLRKVPPTEAGAPRSDWTSRLRALRAPARPAALRRAPRLLSYLLLGTLTGVALLVAAATLPVVFGYHAYIVYGGSMAPSIRAGSVAVSKPSSPQQLEVGHVIARRPSPDDSPVLHRIVDITTVDGQRYFVTQGDKNNAPDPDPVTFEGPGDKVVYSVPYAGYILHYGGSGLGRLLLIAAPLATLAVMVLHDTWRPPRRGKGSGTGSAGKGGGEETSPPDTTPPPQEDEAPRQAAAVLIEPPTSWRPAAPLLLPAPLGRWHSRRRWPTRAAGSPPRGAWEASPGGRPLSA